MKWRGSRATLAYIGMVSPGLAVYLLIVTYPIIYSVWLSLTDFNPNRGGVWNWVGIVHYLTMARDPMFWHALRNNIIVVAVSVFGQIPIGFILAYILFRKSVRASRFFQSMVFLPQFLSTIVIGVLWKRLFEADGPVARLIQIVSGNPAAQFDLMLKTSTVMLPISVALIWMYTGFYMMIFLANLQKIDASMVEAAQIDGARESQILFRVMLPLLSASIFVSVILAISGSLRGFDLIFAMTSRGLSRQNAMVLAIFMYQTAFDDYRNPVRFAYGAAISNAVVLISVLLIVLSNAVRRNLRVDEAE
ncbi:MAG: sugar ABC transporter permease [Spirochaetes bacterium]|nr:sugar ABC transporter permease [Spirochaetota bacterium]